MATPIINTNLGKVVTATGNIADDLSTLRPLLRNMLFSAYATDKIENAPIATFPDGADNVPVKSATFAITPVQDLHGYDSPWPAGGGKNLVFAEDRSGITTQTYVTEVFSLPIGTYTMSADLADANQVGVALRLIKNGVASTTTPYSTTTSPSRESETFTVNDTDILRLVVVGAAAGYNGSVSKVQVEAGSTPTTYAPYSNICPISGHTECEVTRTGRNWFSTSLEQGALTYDGYNQHQTYAYTKSSSTSRLRGAELIYLPPNTTCTVSCDFTKYELIARPFNENKLSITLSNAGYDNSWHTSAWQISGGAYCGIMLRNKSNTDLTPSSATDANIQIEIGSTAHAYEPYAGQTYPISLGQTVYGGTLNVTTGVLTIDRAMVDLGDLTWTKYDTSGTFIFYGDIANGKQFATNGLTYKMLCSQYAVGNASMSAPNFAALANYSVGINGTISTTGTRVLIKDTTYTTAAAFKTAMNGVQLVYELATPVTYDLTGEELATVLGNNNVFSNTGDVTELVYRADTALFVEKKLAE